MAHEELKKQYEEDHKNHDRPWELWEFRLPTDHEWTNCCQGPGWFSHYQYRRKKPPFQPEYFSGLNWHEAKKLVGKVVEYSKDGGYWQGPGTLIKVSTVVGDYQRFLSNLCWWTYVRTTPETYAHPTITIGGVELPRPEVDAPKRGTKYWFVNQFNEVRFRYWDSHTDSPEIDKRHLQALNIHLTEDRAQAWADWWGNTVMAAIKEAK
jgi:hypothetical protein